MKLLLKKYANTGLACCIMYGSVICSRDMSCISARCDCVARLTCTIHKKSLQATHTAVQLLQNAINDLMAGQPAAPDLQGEAAGAGAGAAAAGARKSMRISNAGQAASSAYTFEDNLCEARRKEGELAVSGAPDMPVQGCFCPRGCPGQAGVCTNQVPPIKTEDNVEVTEGHADYGRLLTAKRDIAPGEILTVFGGIVLKKLTHAKDYELFSQLHTVQQRTAKRDKQFEYSAQTGSNDMPGSQAWVIPPEDIPLLQEGITYWQASRSKLNSLVKRQETWQQGLGQFTQHTCCAKHVNAYFFPICTMRKPARGGKRRHDEEVMDIQALAIRAQRAIKKGDEILAHYVGAGKSGTLGNFDCRCCKCFGGGVCSE